MEVNWHRLFLKEQCDKGKSNGDFRGGYRRNEITKLWSQPKIHNPFIISLSECIFSFILSKTNVEHLAVSDNKTIWRNSNSRGFRQSRRFEEHNDFSDNEWVRTSLETIITFSNNRFNRQWSYCSKSKHKHCCAMSVPWRDHELYGIHFDFCSHYEFLYSWVLIVLYHFVFPLPGL